MTSNETRAPLLGVNIVVQNTSVGTTTDQDGHYELDAVSPDAVLVFTYIGFTDQEVAVGNQLVIDVALTPQALPGEELVVVGYGTQQRRDITSSIFSLKEGSFTQGAVTDVTTLLQARVPGVLITLSNGDLGAEPVIRIRGGTSVTAGNGPMIVIDGVPIDNSSATPRIDIGVVSGTRDNPLSMLNPNDIASIDVLKDAAAAAIYGARGGNGVILITTKEGRTGGVPMTYEGYTSYSSVSNTIDLLDAKGYKAFATSPKITAILVADTLTLANIGTDDTDWQDAIFRTAVSQSHHLSFGGGSETSRYLVSLSYLDEEGIILNSARQRFSVRLNMNNTLLEGKLRVALRVNPTYIKKNNTPYQQAGGFEGGLFTNVYKLNPTLPIYLDDGSYYEFPNPGIRNPVALLNEIEDVSNTLRIFFNGSAEYDIIPSLTAKVNLGLDRTSASRNIYQPRSLPYADAFGGRADASNNERQSTLFESTLNYRTAMGTSKIDVAAGYTFQEFENNGFGAIAQDFVTDSWTYNNLAGAANFGEKPFSFRDRNTLISFLGRVNVSLADKLLLSGVVRREGSSRFGENNKWGLFPAASVGYRITEDLKVRGSWGVAGNQDIGNYISKNLLGTAGSNAVIGGAEITGVAETQVPNPDLKWEETTQLNLGLDYSFYRDRISGSLDVYFKTTADLLLEVPVPQPAPVGTRIANIGEVTNNGVEFVLNTVNVSTSNFFWRTSFNFARNVNEVVSLVGSEDSLVGAIFTGFISGAGQSDVAPQIIAPGLPLGTFYGWKFEGYDANGEEILAEANGKWNPGESYVDANLNGKYDEGETFTDDDRQVLGDARPAFTFGITNIINYKNIDIQFFIQGVQGLKIFNNTRLEYQRPSNIFNGINLMAGAVDDVAAGLDPKAAVAYTDQYIEDGSFIRLQNVTIGYTLKTDMVRKLRLYLSADNLIVLTKYTGYDPEVNTFTGRGIGIDYTNVPRARTFTLGISIGL
ncbi:MAG: TonB-dependent receptor [Candidatus Marinimicrobia bacterium]|nr:TonB-dependent receptor [Candidatus Neomarinimicrobiota bacterium]